MVGEPFCGFLGRPVFVQCLGSPTCAHAYPIGLYAGRPQILDQPACPFVHICRATPGSHEAGACRDGIASPHGHAHPRIPKLSWAMGAHDIQRSRQRESRHDTDPQFAQAVPSCRCELNPEESHMPGQLHSFMRIAIEDRERLRQALASHPPRLSHNLYMHDPCSAASQGSPRLPMKPRR